MKRPLQTWLLTLACSLFPALAWAHPPLAKSYKVPVGLQARCPLADGTWGLPSRLSGLDSSMTAPVKAKTSEEESQPAVLVAEKTVGKVVVAVTEPPMESTLCLEVMSQNESAGAATEGVALNAGKSRRQLTSIPRLALEEYIPYDHSSFDCRHWHLKPGLWAASSSPATRKASDKPTKTNEKIIKPVDKASKPIDIAAKEEAANGHLHSVDIECLKDEVVWNAIVAYDYLTDGSAQKDVENLLGLALSSWNVQVNRASEAIVALARAQAREEAVLARLNAGHVECELPAVCTPPPEYLLLTRTPQVPVVVPEAKPVAKVPEVAEKAVQDLLETLETSGKWWEDLSKLWESVPEVATSEANPKR